MRKIVVLGCLLYVMIFSYGCTWSQLGETTAEGNRRHLRVLSINQRELNADIDSALLLDEPSSLSGRRIP